MTDENQFEAAIQIITVLTFCFYFCVLFLQFPVEVPLPLLHNHVACVVPAHQPMLLIIGGGGNCFSFGTRFNCPLRLNMIL